MRYQNVEVQFLYPFEISDWRKFKILALEILDQVPFSKNPGHPKVIADLDKSIPLESSEKIELNKFIGQIKSRKVTNNKELFELIDETLHKNDGHAHELFKVRLKKLKDKIDDTDDERFFNFVISVIKSGGNKVIFDISEKKGTRPYLQKNVPHVMITPPGTDLIINNIDAFPNIGDKLNLNKDGLPCLRLHSNVKVMASGFGLLKMRCCLFTEEGIRKAVDEIVFSSEYKSCSGNIDNDKALLADDINKEIVQAVKARGDKDNTSLEKINDHIKSFCQRHCLANIYITQNIKNLIDRANILENEISTSEVVDIQNLDRGTGWGREPLFEWYTRGEKYGPAKLYNFFDHLINETIINPVHNASIYELFHSFKEIQSHQLVEALNSTLTHIERDCDWYADEGIYPYVLTFVAAPSDFDKPGAKRLSDTEDYYSEQLDKPDNKSRFARLLMKSSWKKIRIDEILKSSLQNIFYSDLLYMAVHPRSTLCLFYLPSDPVYQYKKYPELYNSVKYKRELEDILVSQRILWYMYTSFNFKINQEIKSISRTFENLISHIRKEEFHSILSELTEIIMGIDNRKIAITEVMEDPLNQKGSTLFTEILNKSSEAFRLKQLYSTLNDQLDRLDMLGLHVNQSTNELSSLVIQETTRATQFTIEILEAFFVGVYFAEIIELAAAEWLEEFHIKTIMFFTLAIAIPLIALPTITLIRKSMSRFRGRVPAWQEQVEKIGFGVGLAMISGLVMYILIKSHILELNILTIPLFIIIPVLLYFSWFKIDSQFHKNHN